MSAKKSPLKNVGQKYKDFEVTKAIPISELQCFLIELTHLPTGAQVMHLANDDPENLFCLSFQTLPNNSNGVAHILEHTVLCGSEKFPIKDPFFAMTRRSLNTFMNALTGSDFTCYPAATQVRKDFYNLLEVYLDAVFKPNLNKMSFLQEGHRLEFSKPDDPATPLEYKGIVYNEMKGAMASGNARMTEAINQALFPDVTYGFNSGGDPKDIPSLTYKELRDFHSYHYHPSRCIFFFYGNLPLHEHLDFIAEKALNGVTKAPPLPPVPNQPRFKAPRFIETTYPISSDEDSFDKTMVSFAWLTCHILEQEELLALTILEIILLDTDASPLKMAFLKSGLCKQVLAFLESDINEAVLAIILKGCPSKEAETLEQILKNTLQEIARKGIPLEQIENALHQLEFHRSEIGGDHSPFGLSLFMRSALLKMHGAQAEDGLKIHSLFEKLRKHFVEDPNYLGKLIFKHLLENPHFVRIVMQPDPLLEKKEQDEEKEILERIRTRLTAKEIREIVSQAAELSAFQKKQEEIDQNVLPKVDLEDVQKYSREFPLKEEKAGSLTVYHHECFTNEIVYADLVYHLPATKEEDLHLVRLFTVLMSQMGCGNRNYAQNLDFIQAHTGGIGASLALNLQAEDFNQFFPSLSIRGKALHRKTAKLFQLMHDMATSIDFTDDRRLKEVILKHFTSMESSLSQSGLKYAINLSASCLNAASRVVNTWYGLDYFWKLKEIVQNIDASLKPLIKKFQFYQTHLLCLEDPHLVLTCDAKIYDEIKGHHFYGLEAMETKPFDPWSANYSIPEVLPQGRIISTPIAFNTRVFKTVPYIHPHSPALYIAAHLFDNTYLHTVLREQGGAYGGGASNNAMSGNFYFYSYRDPNIYQTFKAFDEAVRKIVHGKFDASDLEEAKLEMIQAMDNPIAPGSRGDLAYGWLREGKTLAMRQAYRDHLLSLTKEEVIEAVKQEIVPKMHESVPVVFAGKELLEKENALLKKHKKQPLEILSI